MTLARWQALGGAAVAAIFVVVALRERRRGVGSWWAYLVGSTIAFLIAAGSAITNVPVRGR